MGIPWCKQGAHAVGRRTRVIRLCYARFSPRRIPIETYTLVHVVISLTGIATGFVVLAGLLKNQRLDGWTAVFLVTTTAMSLTGFGFPFVRLLPSDIVGAISLVVLAVAIVARYRHRMARAGARPTSSRQ